MYDLSQNGLSHAEVLRLLIKAIESDKVEYRLNILRGGITVASVEYLECSFGCDSAQEVKYTGRIRMRENALFDWTADYLQPVMSFDNFQFPFVPLKPVTVKREIREGITYLNIELYDRSVDIQENSIGELLYISAGTIYTAAIENLLERSGVSLVNIEPSPLTTSADREDWEESDYALTVANQLLREINYTDLAVDREGVLYAKKYVEPSITQALIHYEANRDSVIFSDKESEVDSYKRPNWFKGVAFNPDMEEPLVFIYEITDPSIPISIPRQGLVRKEILQFNNVADMQTLQELVVRHATDVARTYENTTFETHIMPHHDVLEVITLNSNGAQGVFEEVAWQVSQFGPKGRMSHSIRRLIYN